jgi:hypothetical protein
MSARYLTIEDIELFYTGATQHPFVLHSDLLDVMKTAGDISTAASNVLTKVYGALLWSQLNMEANVWGLLPKTTWVRSGWRVKTLMALSADYSIALTETGDLPASVYPDIETIAVAPKVQAEVFDVSDVMEALSSVSSDDIWGAAHQVRAEIGTEFVKLLNKQLLHKVAELGAAFNTSGAFQTLDRVVGKYGEQGHTSGWELVFDITDRTTAWKNAYVNDASATRDLTDSLIRTLLQNTRTRGGNTNVLLTGYDTYATLLGLYMSFVRYSPMSETKAQFGVNGIQTAAGLETGINIASLYNIPIVQSVDCPIGVAGSLSNIYALDTSDPEGYGFPRLGLSVLRPVEYFESRDYVLLNKFIVRGVYRVVGQTVCRNMYGQGKLRDIK